MILYADTSALIKRYVRETGSDEVTALVAQAESVGFAALARVEMAAALAKAVRLGWVEGAGARQAWEDFLGHWPSYVRLNVSPGMLERACDLAWEYGLRGYDAVHLAGALLWQEALAAPVVLAAYDKDLWQAARRAGLETWPGDLVA